MEIEGAPDAPTGRDAPADDVLFRRRRTRPASSRSINQDTVKKAMLLLFYTLAVALIGASFSKYSAVKTEEGVEAGEKELAFHTPQEVIDAKKEKEQEEEKEEKGQVVEIHALANVEGYQPKEMVDASSYVLPGTEDAPPLSAAKGRPYFPTLNHFQHRDTSSPYAKTWGYFDFRDPDPKWDGKMRPQPANFNDAPNRDVKNSDFPDGAWQKDEKYMKEFLTQARLLVNRTIEAVYAEYGVGLPFDGSVKLDEEGWINREAFSTLTLKDKVEDAAEGGWSTKASFDGIARRVIHHVMTGDTFKLVLGGHSAAAGHGAGFNQSYIIEAGHVLEPVFAHLGVDFRAYNFAQGGMGTYQQAMAGMDLRGKETDWIMWDSSMTEKHGG